MAKLDIEQARGGASSCLGWNVSSVFGLGFLTGAGNRGPVFVANHARPPPRPRRPRRRPRRLRSPRPISELLFGNGETWNEKGAEVMEALSRQRVDICGLQEHMFFGFPWTQSGPYNNGQGLQIQVLLPSTSRHIFGKELGRQSYWSPARLWQDHSSQAAHRQGSFYLTLGVCTTSGPTWKWKRTLLWQAAIRCCKGCSQWDTYPSWWLEQSRWHSCQCVQPDTHGGHGFSTCNTAGESILEFAIANCLCVGNTWLKKRVMYLIAYSSSGDSTQADHILYNKSFSSTVSNVKFIPNEEWVKHQHMVVCDFTVHIPHIKNHKFSPHIQTWKLRDPATASQFQLAFKVKMMTAAAAVATAAGADADTTSRVESAWSKLKGPLLGCCHRSLWCLLESPVEIRNLVVEWTGGRSCMREACTVQSLQCPKEGRHDGRGQGGKDCLH